MTSEPESITGVLVVYCTFPDEEVAAQITGTLLSEQLAACVNLLSPVRSLYMWQGRLCDEKECLALIKTTCARFASLRDRIVALHPYECPEVIAVPVEMGHDPYLAWVSDNTSSEPA